MSLANRLKLPQRATWTVAGKARETLFWPCKDKTQPRAVLLMLPGNPGLIDFYTDFCSEIHRTMDESLDIIGVSHLGHSRFSDSYSGLLVPSDGTYGLEDQIESCLAVFDELDSEYSAIHPRPRMLICGHSVGSFIAEKLVECRPDRVDRVYSLFPTVENIADTPRGRQLRMVFRSGVRQIVAQLAVMLTWLLPTSTVLSLAAMVESLNEHNSRTVAEKMLYGSCINNVLKMAEDEMNTITDLNEELYGGALGKKFVLYYGSDDHWVPPSCYRRMKEVNTKGKVIMCSNGFPHSFVTTHAKEMAFIVSDMLREELV